MVSIVVNIYGVFRCVLDIAFGFCNYYLKIDFRIFFGWLYLVVIFYRYFGFGRFLNYFFMVKFL